MNFVAGRRVAVVEDDFYNKLEKLNVQAGKRDKILLAHVQRICEAHDKVMRSYYQQIHSNVILLSANTYYQQILKHHTWMSGKVFADFWVLVRIF